MTMFYDLVVDGGGSKTAVVLHAQDDGQDSYFKGLAGCSNIFSSPHEVVVDAIRSAIVNALQARYTERFPLVEIPALDEMVIRKAYVGLAGALSVNEQKLKMVEMSILRLFKEVSLLKVMTDLLLLPISLTLEARKKYCIAVIAGTGSSALCFEGLDNDIKLLAKSGGWGPQFGDNGGGYSMGKEAIRSTLRALDEYNILLSVGESPTLKSIHERVYFAITGKTEVNQQTMLHDLDKLLRVDNIGGFRQKVASLTKLIFEELDSSDGSALVAHQIISSEIKGICQFIVPFEKLVDFSETTLVVSGTLFSLDYYYDEFCRQLSCIPIVFDSIEAAFDPSLDVLKKLIRS